MKRLARLGLLLALLHAAFTAWASMPRGPRIGILVTEAWFDVAGLNPSAYELAVVRAGGQAVRIRPGTSLEGFAGLVLVGGGDVDPGRDAAELALLAEAEWRQLPVLAICRGAQLLATAHGGALGPSPGHGLAAHAVEIEEGTRTAGIFGCRSFQVSSTHRFAVTDPGRLVVAARDPAGVVEAVELPGPRFVVGLQWHPEWEGLAWPERLAPFHALLVAAK